MTEKIKQKTNQLRDDIRHHEYAYYILSQPKISDFEFDQLLKKLESLEKQHPELITPDSPTQRVGGKSDQTFQPVKHIKPMLSLDNTYSTSELQSWEDRIEKLLPGNSREYWIEPKIDGVGMALTYQDGLLIQAATRGDGETGEDITTNARTIRSVPLRLQGKAPKLLEIRGEVYMNKLDFERFNEAQIKISQETFANPRNAAAGSLRQKNPQVTAQRPLRFLVHSPGKLEGLESQTHASFIKACETFGLPILKHTKQCSNIQKVIQFCQKLEGMRNDIPFETDGAVIKINHLKQQEKIGYTHKSPRWAVAYKFPAQQATTQILNIESSVGRTGTITPVAKLNPVSCGGVTISSASLHNFDEVKRLNVKIGDWIIIERAGEVIPKVIKVIASKRTGNEKSFRVPKVCPICDGPITKEKKEDVAFRCTNPSCLAQLEGGLFHFAGREGLDIEGMGDVVVHELISRNMIKDFADIYNLSKEELLTLPGFKNKKAENLLKAISQSKQKPLSRLIYSLGIRHIGERGAQVLAQHYGKMEKLETADPSELAQLHDVGPIVAESIHQFFKQSNVKKLISKFKKAGLSMIEPVESTNTPQILRGKTIVFTGELTSFTRQASESMVRSLGGIATGNVSKKTDYVIVGNQPGSKYKKARKLGVKILDEKEFFKMIKS